MLQITHPPRIVALVTVFSSMFVYWTFQPASLREATFPVTEVVVAVVLETSIRSPAASRLPS